MSLAVQKMGAQTFLDVYAQVERFDHDFDRAEAFLKDHTNYDPNISYYINLLRKFMPIGRSVLVRRARRFLDWVEEDGEQIVFNPRNRMRGGTLTQVSSRTTNSQPTQLVPCFIDVLKGSWPFRAFQKKEHSESVGLCVTPISSDFRRDSFKDYQEQMERVEAGHELMWDAPLPTRKQPCVGDYFIFWFYKEKIIVHRITDIRGPNSRPANWTTPGHADRNVVYLSPECCRMDWATFQEANGYKRCMGTVCAVPSRLATILPAIEHALSEMPVA